MGAAQFRQPLKERWQQQQQQAAAQEAGSSQTGRQGLETRAWGSGRESWDWPVVWHWVFWGWINYTWLITKEMKFYKEPYEPRSVQGVLFWNRGLGVDLAAFQPSLCLTEPRLERPSPTRPLQRQTTWAGRSLRDLASPKGRLLKSGSLGSAREAQPTVEAGVAHSECP